MNTASKLIDVMYAIGKTTERRLSITRYHKKRERADMSKRIEESEFFKKNKNDVGTQ